MASMSCADWMEKLTMHSEELTPAEWGALEEHLRSCPVCRQERACIEVLGHLLRVLPGPVFPQGLPARIQRELDDAP